MLSCDQLTLRVGWIFLFSMAIGSLSPWLDVGKRKSSLLSSAVTLMGLGAFCLSICTIEMVFQQIICVCVFCIRVQCTCVYYLCVQSLCVYAHLCLLCGSQSSRSASIIFLNHSPPQFFEAGSLPEPRDHQSARVRGQQNQGPSHFHLCTLGLRHAMPCPGFCVGCGDPTQALLSSSKHFSYKVSSQSH